MKSNQRLRSTVHRERSVAHRVITLLVIALIALIVLTGVMGRQSAGGAPTPPAPDGCVKSIVTVAKPEGGTMPVAVLTCPPGTKTGPDWERVAGL
jgi:hypothetical protein